MINVALVTPNIAHYRRHLYKLLDASTEVSVHHYSDPTVQGDIASLDAEELESFIALRNRKVGPFKWQSGAIRAALDQSIDSFVFTGDVKILSTWAAALLARTRGKNVYFWTIGWHRPERGFKRFMRLTFYRIAHELLVYGDAEKDLAIRHGYLGDRISVIYNSVSDVDAVDVDSIAGAAKEVAVGAVARLTPTKNFILLLEAVSLLKEAGMAPKIILAGDGPQRAVLTEQASILGLDCEFMGAVYAPEEIASFYRRVMVTVIPSAAGLTTVQSMAHGVPVVTDDDPKKQMPEANAIVPGLTGSRYGTGDANALASEIRKWVTAVSQDPAKVAVDCLEEVRTRWSPHVQARRMIDAIGGNSRIKQ